VSEAKEYSLGPLPWNKEMLHKAYFSNLVSTTEAIKEHPGYEVESDLFDLRFALEIFLDSVADLLLSIADFGKECRIPGFWHRGNKNRVVHFERRVRHGVSTASMSLFSLVDVSRRVSRHYKIEGYEENVKSTFAENGQHRFIQCLRNYITHVRLAESGWHITWARKGTVQTQFLLKTEDLLSWKGWDKLALSFISRYPKGIDLKLLFESYAESVGTFQQWFIMEIEKSQEDQLAEYRSYDKLLKSFAWKSFWELMLGQVVIRNGIDPYQHLDKHLTPDEIAEVLAMPKYSRQQVDRIIEIVDEKGLVDEELRDLAYRAFKVQPGGED